MKTSDSLIGVRFGRLVVIEENVLTIDRRKACVCKCDCGEIKTIRVDSLKKGAIKSCGCLHADMAREKFTTHGHLSNGNKNLKEYSAWSSMKARCSNPNHPQFYDWGGRGVVVCERWLNSFDNFLEDMRFAPSKRHTLDRYPNNNGNYEPDNCRWATYKQQAENKRNTVIIEYKGQKKCIREWSVELSVPYSTINFHIKKGKPFDWIYNYFKK
jgi:hypothetical protein